LSKHFAYLLIASDPYVEPIDGSFRKFRRVSKAYELTKLRLEKSKWPLFQRTPNRGLVKIGDRVYFYVAGAGEKAKQIIARATVSESRARLSSERYIDGEYITDVPHTILELDDVCMFKSSVPIREVIRDLSICPKDPRFYGTRLQGGCAGITQDDEGVILDYVETGCR